MKDNAEPEMIYKPRHLRFAFAALVVGSLALAACQSGTGPPGSPAARDERPNILLVVVDDLGFTDVGAYGGEINTPTIDALAREGVRFSNFHTAVSCSPTRSMLLSGTDNHVAGLGNMAELLTPNQRGKPGYEGYLNDRVMSLAEVFAGAGYHTYMAGKWHLGDEPEHIPHARGFQRTFSLLYGGASHWSDMEGLIEAQTPAKYSLNGEPLAELPADFHSSRSYADFIIDSIRADRESGEPFLAFLSFTAPHDPLHVPEPWLSKYRGRYDDGYEVLKQKRIEATKREGLVAQDAAPPARHSMLKPWDSLSDREKAIESRMMEVYAGMVDNLDYHLGRVLDYLKDIGEYENTLIVWMSDNGANPWTTDDYPGNRGSEFVKNMDNRLENIGRPGSGMAYGMGWATAAEGPFDYFKMTVGEGGIHVPLIITGPGVSGGGKTIDGFAYVMDLMPTMMAIAGVEHPGEYEGKKKEPMLGRSLVRLLSGEADTVYGPDEYIGGEMGNGRWMRKGDYKATMVAKPYGPAEWALYDVVNDPGETRNLAADKPEVLEELQAAWERYSKEVGVVVPQG